MKRNTHKLIQATIISLALSLCLIGNTATGQQLVIDQTGRTDIVITENSFLEFSATNAIAEIRVVEMNTEYGVFSRLAIPGYVKNLAHGHPELPVFRKLIEIPVGANPQVIITSYETLEIQLQEHDIINKLYPCQPPRSKGQDEHELVYDVNAYQVNAFNDDPLVTVDILGIMRNVRLARLNISPVQYNPVTNTIRVYKAINFKVVFDGADIAETMELKERFSSPFFENLNKRLINYHPVSNRENFMRYPVKYVIISNRMFESQLQALIEWKKLKGFTVVEAYTDQPHVGTTNLAIKSYIDSLYNAGTVDDPAPSFILFVGDVQQIPTWEDGNGETDRLFCEFTGDLMPEIYYGRYSAQTTAQLQPQIDKTLQYEKYTMPDPSYLNEVVLVAGVDASFSTNWANGQINYGTTNYFNEDHGITSHTYLYPQSGSSSSAIIQNVSDGVTFGNYTAHCSPQGWSDPSFTVGDVATLQNQDMYGVLVGNCCSSSEYATNECFGEALLRAENKGTVSYIGASNSTYWDEDYYWGVGVGTISQTPPPYEETGLGMYDRAFHDHGEEFGDWYLSQHEMVFAGNLAVQEGSPSSANYYWDIYNVLGDPSLMVYFSEPPVMSVNHVSLLPLGSTSFTVTTEPYAYVALSMDGEQISAALADADGIAILTMDPLDEAGLGDVVVTKQNGQPFFGTVLITNPAGPYLVFSDFEIDDATGNNNGFADFGEHIKLDITLENIGLDTALQVIATVSAADDYLSLIDTVHEWGMIPGNTSMLADSAFTMDIALDAPDQHVVSFDMLIEDLNSEQVWMEDFDLLLNAPVLKILEMVIDDSQNGNDNGRLDPGENAIIKIKNKNTGHCPAENTVASIATISQYLTLYNTVDTLETLGLLGHKYAEFEVDVDPDAPNGVVFAEFDYELCSGIFEEDKSFTRKIGLLVEDWETGDFSAFNWQHSGDQPWEITTLFPYEQQYHARSGIIDDNETSILSLSMEIMTADTIYFWRKVSSHASDNLKFYIDNDLMGDWSGIGSYAEEKYRVETGQHTFKWVYEKSSSGSSGSDAAWIDFIIMPPRMTLTCYAGQDASICAGDDYQCHGGATDWDEILWTTSGTGTFDDPTILEPVYTPSADDIINGSVELTITAENAEASADDEMMLTIMDEPAVPEMPDGPDYIDLMVTTSSDYIVTAIPYSSEYSWQIDPLEAGTISGNTTTGNVQWNQSYLGSAMISVKAINDCGESDYSEEYQVMVDNTTGITEVSDDLIMQIYPNPFSNTLHLRYQISDIRYLIFDLYSIAGVRIERLLNDEKSPGEYELEIGLGSLPEGIYFIRVQAGDKVSVNKIVKIN